MTKVLEYLPSKHKALSLNPSVKSVYIWGEYIWEFTVLLVTFFSEPKTLKRNAIKKEVSHKSHDLLRSNWRHTVVSLVSSSLEELLFGLHAPFPYLL
jgi:hypothetical protein